MQENPKPSNKIRDNADQLEEKEKERLKKRNYDQ